MDVVVDKRADEAGIRILHFDDVLKAGEANANFVVEEPH
jgi:hypothetical protein